MLSEVVEDFQVPEFMNDLRSHKFLGISAFDVVLTLLCGIIISEKLVPVKHRQRVYWFIMPFSIMVHVAFNQDTKLTHAFCSKNIWVLGLFIFCLVKTIDN